MTTEPRGCLTCRHALSHGKCDGCIVPQSNPFVYLNWEPGNRATQEADLLAAELAGTRAVVVSGEADLLASDTPAAAYKKLFRAACECGYVVSRVASPDGASMIDVGTGDGHFRLRFGRGGLATVHRVLPASGGERLRWARDGSHIDPQARELPRAPRGVAADIV